MNPPDPERWKENPEAWKDHYFEALKVSKKNNIPLINAIYLVEGKYHE